MALPEHFLMIYGYALLFAWVLLEQLGLPLPAMPALLAAGALSAQHQLSFTLALLAGLAASLMADSTWFLIGRRYGLHVLRLLCKLSLEPTICVRRTQISFGRRRAVTIVIAKFVPGLSILAPPVAGQNGMSYARFLFLDGIGSALWVGTLLAAGRFSGDLLQRNPGLLGWVGRFSGALLLLVTLGLFVGRLVRRRMILKKLAAARLEPEELKNWIDSSEPVYVVDLRDPYELLAEPFTLPGALHFAPGDLTARHHEIPRDRDIVLFCSCPSEATAAKTALTLFRLGIQRVRPLRGGYDEWKRLGFPLDSVVPAIQPAK
jgi:membrane protein DedA with SNARE-associated domain/rhodanese-related sulfurtransferase